MRIRVLIFTQYYVPGYKSGGPVRTIANLTDRLGDEFDLWIATTDRDALDERAYPDVEIDQWTTVGKAHVFYASPDCQRLRGVADIMRAVPHDVLYLNSFFATVATIKPLLARRLGIAPRRPLIVAPRGEFSEGALSLKSAKKRMYLTAARILGLYQGAIWQASSEHEATYIRRTLRRMAGRVVVAPDLPALPGLPAVPSARGAGSPLRIVYLSRISPMKNLEYALQVLARVACPVRFDVIGLIDDAEYWEQCQDLIRGLPKNVGAAYIGVLKHEEVHNTLGEYDLFFLPTRGENYGHAIVEALTAGVPVLISDTTPWRNLQGEGVGWSLPLEEPGAFVDAIESQAHMTNEEREAQRMRAARYGQAVSVDETTVEQNRALFMEAIRKDRP